MDDSTLTTAAPGASTYRRWNRFALRGLKVVGAAFFIAGCLWALFNNPFGVSLVYSLCISISIWLCIDLGRDAVASFTARLQSDPHPSRSHWPGWIWMLVIVAVGAVVGYAIGIEIGNWLTGGHSGGPFNSNPRQTLALLIMSVGPAVMITYFFQSREIIALQQSEVDKAKRQAAEQQLKLLESQLEPHMLFNTLANLRALIALDPPRAQAMLDQLIAFLRASLAGSRARLHPLADEFQRLRDYLALMEIRMGPRLQTQFDLPTDLAAAQVPPLLLQPLVENAIKHGLEPQVAGGRIDIAATRDGDSLVLEVRDSGVGVDLTSTGENRYGMAHIRERLATLYGDRASFTLEPAPEGARGTLATIRMPLQESPLATAAGRDAASAQCLTVVP